MWDTIKSHLTALSFEKLLPSILALVIGLIVAKILCRLFDRALGKSRLDASLHSFVRSLFHGVLYIIVILIVAGTLGFNVSSLVALLSVVSLAVSLAIQGALANIAGGIQVLSSHLFRVGDYVQLGDISGTVKEIRMVYTVITTTDNKDIFIPNSDVSAARITNYTTEAVRRVDLTFCVSYDADVDTVKAALRECAAVENVLDEPAVFVGLDAFGESTVSYVLRAWCKTEHYWDVYFAIQENAQRVLKAANVELSYPHLNVHMN